MSNLSQASEHGDPTQQVQAQNIVPANTYLELQLIQQGVGELRIPFIEAGVDLSKSAQSAFPPQEQWRATVRENQVLIEELRTGQSYLLVVGEKLEIHDNIIWLIDTRQAPVGSLEGVNPPFSGRVWHIKPQQTFLGRAGKRLNHIELPHPTISRTHATFFPDRHGYVRLLNEAAGTATTINGVSLEKGEQTQLKSGDLIGFGELILRFVSNTEAADSEGLISLITLGSFQFSLGTHSNKEIEIKKKKCRWLLALLAHSWGKTVAVESIIDKLWPEVVTLRGRKNLSNLLSHIQEALELDQEEFNKLIIRSTSTLQLNPSRLASHDYNEVEKLTHSGEALNSEVALERLVNLYQGRFLPSCYDEWAEEIRNKLELNVMDTLLATAHKAKAENRPEMLQLACRKLLELEPSNEDVVELIMRDALSRGDKKRALDAYQELSRVLSKDDLSPSPELTELRESLRI